MLKKIFIITTVLLLITLVFFGIYLIAFKTDTASNNVIEATEEKLDIVEVLDEKMIHITSDSIISATIGPDKNTIRYYDALSGDLWTMTLRGSNKKMLAKSQGGAPKDVQWSQDGEMAILKYENGDIFVQNYSSGSYNKLRDGMDKVMWTGVSGKILYQYYDEGTNERSLNIADSDGTNWKKITELPFRHSVFIQIPSSILAAVWPQPDINTSTDLFTTSVLNDTSENQSVFIGKTGANFLFSPDGNRVLVSHALDNGKKITLGVMNSDGKEYNDLMIPTIVDKAVWSKDSKAVYYAQPSNVPGDVVWPNDYLEGKFKTKDTLYKLDVETGKKTRIIELEEISEQIDAESLFLSPLEDTLFFKNRINNLLYRINL